jgi:hypothetical protein
VDFIHGQQAGTRVPALAQQDGAVGGNIPVQILRWLETIHQVSAKRCLANLPWAGKQNQFSPKVARDEIVKVVLYSDCFIQS